MADCTLKPKTILNLYVIDNSKEHTEKTTVYSMLYIALNSILLLALCYNLIFS